MRSKVTYCLVILALAGVVNGASMRVLPAYSSETQELKLQEFGGVLNTSPDGNINGCEQVPESDRSSVEACAAVAVKVAKFVAEAAGSWVVGKGLDYMVDKAGESSADDASSGDDGESSFERAAKESGDSYHGGGGVAREPNALAVPESDFDPK